MLELKTNFFRTIKGAAGRLAAIPVLLLVLMFSGSASGADWAANYGGIGGANAVTNAKAVDAAGNVYMAGYFDGATFTLGGVTLSRIGSRDAFVVKLDSSGNVTWAKNFGGSGALSYGQSIAVDDSGNVYLGGYFSSANLTTPSLTKIGSQDAFAVKLDSSGTTTWAKNFGGSGASASGYSINVDGSGSVYLGGYFINSLTTPSLTKIGSQDAFAIKLDSNGTITWAKNFGGSGASTFGISIAVDGSGNVCLGGYFYNANLTTPALTKIGTYDAFVLKLDSSGNITWAKNLGGSGASAYGNSIAVDGSGNVYLGGAFNGASLTIPSLTNIGTYDAFAIKLDSSGNTTWAKNFGGSGASAYGNSIAVDSSGNVYLGGFFNASLITPSLANIGSYDAFALKLDSSGNTTWAKNFGGSGAWAVGNSIAVDGSGNVYLSGYFNGSLTTPSLTNIGTKDAFAVKLDSSGTTTWAKNFGTLSPGTARTLATTVDAYGNVYVAGYFDVLQFTLGSVTLSRIGAFDAFVAKLDTSGAVLWAKNFGGSGAYAYGQSIAVDNSGNVYLGGYFQYANLSTPALTKIGTQDAFAVKLDSSGNTAWAKNFGGSGAYAYGQSITVDGSKNVYLGGYFQYANLTTPALTKIGSADAFAIKLDSAGATTWAKNYGGSGASAYGRGIAVDGSENVYLGGDFNGANLTTPDLTKINFQDAFAIKLDSSGNTAWAKNFGGQEAYGRGIAVDGSGNVYLGGDSYGNFTTPVLSKIGNRDAFAIKLDSSGNTSWAKNFGGSGTYAYGQSIVVDGSGNVYLGGYFNVYSLTTPALTKIGTYDAFAVRLDSSGNTTWAKNFGGSGASAYGNSIAVDGSGNVYLGGYFYTANLTTPALTKIGGNDAYIISVYPDPAPTGTITINSGATYAGSSSVDLTLSCTDAGGCAEMQFSNDNANWSTAEAYATSKTWTLTTGDGTKTVYVKFKDTAGNWSSGYSDTIIVDGTAPTTAASPIGWTYVSAQSVTLTANESATIYYTADGTTPTIASTVYSGPIRVSANTTIKFFAVDSAGNSEAVKTEVYTLTTVPTGGTVWGWGDNGYGQLGDGTTNTRNTPVQTSWFSGAIAIAGGGSHTTALKNDGTVWAWGWNNSGRLGDGTTTTRYTPVQVSGLSGVTAIAGGNSHTIALKSDGTVWAWGYNNYGQLGDGTTTSRYTPVQVSGLSGITAIAGGWYHTIALKNDGTVWGWGRNSYGQLGDGTTIDRYTPVQVSSLSGVTAIAGGDLHTIALKSDGTIRAWGYNNYGQLGDGTTSSRYTPVQVGGLSGVTAVAGGVYRSVALKSDGTVREWGLNNYGQLGDGTTTNRYTPVQASGLTGVSAIAGGVYHSIALKNDGTVWTWGYNFSGQLGDGTNTSRYTPGQVSGLSGVIAIAGGGNKTTVIQTDATPPTTTPLPAGGTYSSAPNVTLSTNEPATIYYTTDGTTPTISSTVYTGPISISSTTTLKYYATDWAGNTEAVKSEVYTININPLAPSALDATFDGDGKVTTAITTSTDYAYSLAIQSDGKIVAAGYAATGTGYQFAVARYNADGSMDTTFDGDGKVTTAIGGYGNATGRSVAIQSDGKIVVAGYASNGSDNDFAVARYNADGSLDATFGTSGKVMTAIGADDDWAYGLAIQSDGKIVVAGEADNVFAMARYNADGSLDISFGTGGKVTTAGTGTVYGLAIQSEGKIVVAGEANLSFGIARYNADGSLDTIFGSGGMVTTAIGINSRAQSLAIQSDGKIVAAGEAWNGSNYDFAIARYNVDGSLDTTFDGDGKITTAIGTGTTIGTGNDEAHSVAIQSNGKIVAAGFAYIGSNYDIAVVRYNADGSLDTTFDFGGKITTAMGTSHDFAYDVAIQSDGKIVAAGGAYISGSDYDFAIIRYNGDGLSDTTAPTTTASPAGGTYASAQIVTLTANETSTIYYTTDGSTPTTSSTVYSGPISISSTTTLKFFAKDSAGNVEAVKTEVYTINIDSTAPITTASVSGGTYTSAQSITLTANETATIYYTTDGSTPTTSSTVYSGPISISSTTTLKFFAKDAVGNTEAVKTEIYTINIDTTAPTTTASPAGGTYTSSQGVTLTANETATIYYTTDGSTPTTSSTVYSGPISISAITTLKFFAKDGAGNSETVKTAVYTIKIDSTAPTTTASVSGGTYTSAQSITLTANETATIYYTTDGSTPTTSSTVYSGPISISSTTTLKFFAKDAAGNSETVKTVVYTINGATSQGTFAYVPNSGSNTVSVINTSNDAVVATISGLGSAPYGVAITPGGTKVYVTNLISDNVSVIDAATNTVTATIPVGDYPNGIAMNPAGTMAYIGYESGGYISAIDTATDAIVATIPVSGGANGIEFTPDGKTAYGANYFSASVLVIDTTTNTVTATIPVGYKPTAIAINPAGTRIYVTCLWGSEIYVIDTATNAVTSVLSINTPLGIAMHPDGTKVYVSNYTGNSLSVIDTATNNIIATVYVGANPYGVAIDPSGAKVYVANYSSSSVSVVDTASNSVIETVSIGSAPYSLGKFITSSSFVSAVPTVTASPAGGTYVSSQTVILTCSDGTGSGCDKIYYTTDGSTPTTSSSLYSAPISISATAILKFFAVDKAGDAQAIRSETYVIKPVVAVDTMPPGNPSNLNAVSTSDGSISLSWTAPSDSDLNGYNIYRDGIKINGSLVKTKGYKDVNTTNGTSYTYRITSVDLAGNESSGASTTGTSTMQANATPSAPSGVKVEDLGTGYSVKVAWLPNAEASISGYRVYWGTSPGTYTNSQDVGNLTSYTIMGLTAGTRCFIAVAAYNTSGVEGAKCAEYTVVPKAVASRPASPTSLTATPGNGYLTVSWPAVSNVAGYKVYIGDSDGMYGVPVRTSGLTYTFENLENGKSYYIAVSSYDLSPGSAYTVSSESERVVSYSMPYDNESPAVPSGLSALDGGPCGCVHIKWDRGDNFDIAGYMIAYKESGSSTFIDTETLGKEWGHTVSGLTGGKTYTFNLYAYDESGNFSAPASIDAAVTGAGGAADTTPPGAPLLSAVPGDRKVELKITPPSDSDIDHYNLYVYNLAAGKYMPLASLNGLAYEHSSGVENGKALVYVATAVDASGNESGYSKPASAVPAELVGDIPLEEDPPVLNRVDGYDVNEMAKGFGSEIGRPNYNPNADLDGNGMIDGNDLMVLAPNHGKRK